MSLEHPQLPVPDASMAVPVPLPMHRAGELTRGGNQAWIEHQGQIYTLRITRAGKLILTK